jgi:hypothetical protein
MSVGNLSNELWLMPALAFTHEQEFTSPGTWTCPSTTTHVEVIVVGGGGGSGGGSHFTGAPVVAPNTSPGGTGGGGAVIRKWVPVSAPVPVTVGAGGTAGTISPTVSGSPPYTVVAGGNGGTSAFGPLAPPVPPTTVQAGGGGGGGSNFSDPTADGSDAPIYGGGGGGRMAPSNDGRNLGYYGAPSLGAWGGGARSTVLYPSPLKNNGTSGMGYGNFGGGGAYSGSMGGPGVMPTPATTLYLPLTRRFGGGWCGYLYSDGVANTGGGAGSNSLPTAITNPLPIGTTIYFDGATGGSGIVIVRWKE